MGKRLRYRLRKPRMGTMWYSHTAISRTERELPPSVEYPSEIIVDTKAVAAGGSVGVLHTGTCGGDGWQNTVMLHGLRAE